jgi:hypothetical protein
MLTRTVLALALILGTATACLAQETAVVALGLTDHAVTQEELQSGAALATPKFNTPGVAYVLVAHAKKGDKVEVALTKDGEPLLQNARELDGDEDGVLVLAGKTGVPAGGWPAGNYTARAKITRGGETLAEQETDPIPFD